jgi:beta-glucosidase
VAFPAPKGAPAWGGGEIYDPSSPLAALKARAAGGEISFSSGADIAAAVSAAKSADVAVVFATQWSTEAMDLQLSLPDGQDALIAAVAAANPHTIVVLETGGPVTMPWLDRVGAVVEAWYPGAKGGEAIAKLLYGDIDAQGRLPVTFPKSEAQLPRPVLPGAQSAAPESLSPDHGAGFDVPYPEGADVGYRWFEKQGLTPLFSFGHGLSYTRFHYSGLKLTGGGTLKASFTVTNIGARAGVDTPQVYASAPKGTRHLIGWKKLALKPGEIRRVEIVADPRLLAVFNTAQPGWSLADGDYQVSVGYEAGQAQLSGRTHLGPKMLKP